MSVQEDIAALMRVIHGASATQANIPRQPATQGLVDAVLSEAIAAAAHIVNPDLAKQRQLARVTQEPVKPLVRIPEADYQAAPSFPLWLSTSNGEGLYIGLSPITVTYRRGFGYQGLHTDIGICGDNLFAEEVDVEANVDFWESVAEGHIDKDDPDPQTVECGVAYRAKVLPGTVPNARGEWRRDHRDHIVAPVATIVNQNHLTIGDAEDQGNGAVYNGTVISAQRERDLREQIRNFQWAGRAIPEAIQQEWENRMLRVSFDGFDPNQVEGYVRLWEAWGHTTIPLTPEVINPENGNRLRMMEAAHRMAEAFGYEPGGWSGHMPLRHHTLIIERHR